MVDCLRDQPDPTGSSPGFQARLKPRLETRRLAGGISWSRRQSTMDSLSAPCRVYAKLVYAAQLGRRPGSVDTPGPGSIFPPGWSQSISTLKLTLMHARTMWNNPDKRQSSTDLRLLT